MTLYRYRAIGSAGTTETGTLEAGSRDAALDALRAMGLLPIEATEHAGTAATATARPWWKRDIKLGGATPSAKGLGHAIQEVAVLLEAGLPLDRALAILAGQGEHKPMRPALEDVLTRVRGGAPLSEAVRAHPAVFPPVAIALVEAGEASGHLHAALHRLAAMLLRAEQLRDQLRSALIYPILLCVAAGGSVLILLTIVVPQFEAFFEGSRVALPTATVVVLAVSRFVREFGPLVAIAALALPFALGAFLRRPGAQAALDGALLNAPLLGGFTAKVETARFARTLGTLVENGVALANALPIARRTFANTAMAAAIDTATQSLKEGEGLAGPLEATRLLPPIAITFLRTGEETGRLGDMLTRLADALDRDIQKTTSRVMALLVPVITIVLGVVVAVIVGAILTAMLSINELAA